VRPQGDTSSGKMRDLTDNNIKESEGRNPWTKILGIPEKNPWWNLRYEDLEKDP